MKIQITKRSGELEDLHLNKIQDRISNVAYDITLGKLNNIDCDTLAIEVVQRLYNHISSTEIDEITATLSIGKTLTHPEYATLAGRIAISNMHKNVNQNFLYAMQQLNANEDINGEPAPLLNEKFMKVVKENADRIQEEIKDIRDYSIEYFGFKTLERSYLMKKFDRVTKKRIIVERPQHMFMRVSIGLHYDDLEKVFETYHLMSQKYFIHATPTLFNAGTRREQLSSCFLLSTQDSLEGIFKTITDCAKISKWAGGIGVHISNIRANKSIIRSTNGTSDGVVPMLKVYNDVARYINQAGKRNGSFAIYLEPWHADILDFLEMKKPHGEEMRRARDLFYAVWIPDLFMEAVKNNDDWYLMCPDQSPGLPEAHNEKFVELYNRYVKEGKYIKIVKAREVWNKIIESQIESGVPYIGYKDAVNRKTNQSNIGTIKSSNLCVAPETKILTETGWIEIQMLEDKKVKVWNGEEYSETIVRKTSDSSELIRVMFADGFFIDCTKYHKFYIETQNGNIETIQASDLLFGMKTKTWKEPEFNSDISHEVVGIERTGRISKTYCFNEPKKHAGIFNGILAGNCIEIMEYSDENEYGTCNLASLGLPKYIEDCKFNYEKLHEVTKIVIRNLNNVIDVNYYPTPETKRSNMRHRPVGLGIQGLADVFALMRIPFDSPEAMKTNQLIVETMYHAAIEMSMELAKEQGPYETFEGSPASKGILQFDMWNHKPTDRYDWNRLKDDVMKHGLRNSLLIALMPTASSSSILGNTECFECPTSNLYVRRVLSGEFVIVNRHLAKDLLKLNLWTKDVIDQIVLNNGSVQNIAEIPEEIKALYKTMWEISQKVIIDQATERGPFVCQSQSMNIWMENPTYAKLSSMHFYGWSKNLKTGSYYIRSKPATTAIQFTLDPNLEKEKVDETEGEEVCRMEEGCIVCSS